MFRERPDDLPLGVMRQVVEECVTYGIEVEAPKPSCSLIPSPRSQVLREFVKAFRVGRPVVRLALERSPRSLTIKGARIYVSAPCGMTWYVVKNLIGYEFRYLDPEEIRRFYDKIALLHHAYPCTASMVYDKELGDTVLHHASYIDRESVLSALGLRRAFFETIKERLKRKLSI